MKKRGRMPFRRADRDSRATLCGSARRRSVSRWLHIYLSMVSFVILFFFAVTGLTLNHQDGSPGSKRRCSTRARWIRSGWVRVMPPTSPGWKWWSICERTTRSRAQCSEFRVDDAQCSVSFKGPGYTADVFIDRATGAYDVTETKMGLAAVLNDLHKGRDAGKAWGVVIDISAIFMTLVSITGLVMICFMQKKRFSGLMATVVGAALCLAVYWIWVP